MRSKIATKDDWNIEEMPRMTARFVLKREFSAEEMEALRKGNIPQEMEDKWFWYMENDTLYAHRSWTGICIYIIEFKKDGKNVVRVNRSQYEYAGKKEELIRLNNLLDWWIKQSYDYYGEWLSETADAIRNNRNNRRMSGK